MTYISHYQTESELWVRGSVMVVIVNANRRAVGLVFPVEFTEK